MLNDFFVCYAAATPTVEMAIKLASMESVTVWAFDGNSAWLVRSQSSAPQLRDELGPLAGKRGNLFIAQIGDAACWIDGGRNPLRDFQERFHLKGTGWEQAD
jgi:hypothetical protein